MIICNPKTPKPQFNINLEMKILISVLFGLALANMALPPKPQGIPIKKLDNPKVRIDLWEDVLCSACAQFDDAFSNYFLKQTYNGKPIWETVEIWIHQFPLPYHHNAFFATKIIPLVLDKS